MDCKAIAEVVLMVLSECMAHLSLLISYFSIVFPLSLRIRSSCNNLHDWLCVTVLVKLLLHGLCAMAAGIEAEAGTGPDEEVDGPCVCWLITLIACVKESN